MNTDLNKILPSGFGERLKEERKRLKLSQTQLGEIGGVAKLAQLQYESEATSPTIRYMTAIAEAGVDVNYLLFGMRFEAESLTTAQLDKIEDRAFEWVEAVAEKRSDGKLNASSRRLLYQVIRNVLIQIEQGTLPATTDIGSFIASDIALNRGR